MSTARVMAIMDATKVLNPIAELISEYSKPLKLPFELKENIRIEAIKHKYDGLGYEHIPTHEEFLQLIQCRCCTRHNPYIEENEIIPNKWEHRINAQAQDFPYKRCACPCRHLARRTVPDYQVDDGLE